MCVSVTFFGWVWVGVAFFWLGVSGCEWVWIGVCDCTVYNYPKQDTFQERMVQTGVLHDTQFLSLLKECRNFQGYASRL